MPAIARADLAEAQAGAQKLDLLLQRSSTDPEFRQLLLTSPHQALEAFSGKSIPQDHRVVFIENKGGPTVVLPPFIESGLELSEQELEAVAGGSEPVSTTLLVIAAAVGSAAVSAAGALWVLKNI
ncbi:MAG TPA: class IIb bacteriocin, lactobin A/cerein 7B family [Gemmatimonadaceae bacterium]|nr:class IIb bacteriocin, lactobin A/cerein 7B family [Gemmatimonadaceae bacterium]